MTTSMRKSIGWGLALVSAAGLALGLMFLCLALALQLIEPRGFEHNLMGFAVVVGVCPLPLTVISGVGLLIGLGLVYFAHREP